VPVARGARVPFELMMMLWGDLLQGLAQLIEVRHVRKGWGKRSRQGVIWGLYLEECVS
jgi:hypothetical protein